MLLVEIQRPVHTKMALAHRSILDVGHLCSSRHPDLGVGAFNNVLVLVDKKVLYFTA